MSSDILNFNKPCSACRRRKVRCDKAQPCNNCARHGVTCVYETSRESVVNQQILQERVERLERIVEEMAALTMSQQASPCAHISNNKAGNVNFSTCSNKTSPGSLTDDTYDASSTDTGSQIFHSGSSYHIGADHWMNLEHPLYEADCMLNISSSEDVSEDGGSWPLSPHPLRSKSLSQLHLPHEKEDILIRLFFAHVEPFIRIVHQGFVWQMIASFRNGMSTSSKEVEALMFSMQYIAVSILPAAVVEEKTGLFKTALTSHLQRAAEMALENADVMRSRNMVVLSALLYYITCKFHIGDCEVASTLLGIAGNIAKRTGMHRDPSYYGYTSWFTEMRRRIWGQYASLDVQSNLFDGSDAYMTAASDVQRASNANDCEWTPSYISREAGPPDLNGYTDNACALIRREITRTSFRVADARRNAKSCDELIAIIDETEKYLGLKFLNHFDGSIALHAAITYWTRAMIRALHVTVLYYHAQGSRAGLPCHDFEKLREQYEPPPPLPRYLLYSDCIDCLEEFQRGEAVATPHHWQWMFRWPMPIHAITGILAGLARQPNHPETDRAWEQVDAVFRRYNNDEMSMAKIPAWHAIEIMCERAMMQHSQISHGGRSYTRRIIFRGFRENGADGCSEPMKDLQSMNSGGICILDLDVATPSLTQMLAAAEASSGSMHLGGLSGMGDDAADYFMAENHSFPPLDI
ncbi:hypothetical protein B0I35DRAFT_480890 [Stachybotrys elegans]|uniref:Zn(2)-C6 fungal-type domain-containing protein n=1 Tax=Stachybotrys elegans TaxID=80388 RepID=A0A8K0SN88_9HYPO|nr:hypothetical protein B0I35DRAFT_480890 [Stachybotrys elegans]